MYETLAMYIDGQWCQSVSNKTYKAINPAKGESFALVPEGTREDARRAVTAANEVLSATAAAHRAERIGFMQLSPWGKRWDAR